MGFRIYSFAICENQINFTFHLMSIFQVGKNACPGKFHVDPMTTLVPIMIYARSDARNVKKRLTCVQTRSKRVFAGWLIEHVSLI